MTESNWDEAQAEYDLYDISDLETGEASGLPQEHLQTTESHDKAKGGLMAWLRRRTGTANVEDGTPSSG